MKLDNINKFQQSIDKYKTAKSTINKDIATNQKDESEKIDRSGNQDTPVGADKQDFLGTNSSGQRDKSRPENLS
ncbi:MAG: hypothetical protein M0P71_13745 [Melioribacteraceae bacterium]|nr:hypothetical protein [Melioribacteraceae bacterium]